MGTRGDCLRLAWLCWLLSGASGCGDFVDGSSSGAPRVAEFETLSIELLEPEPETQVWPGDTIRWRSEYSGDLARPPKVAVVAKHVKSGNELRQFVGSNSGQQESRKFNLTGAWKVGGDVVRQSGELELHLELSVTSTIRDSEPWIVSTEPLVVDLEPRLESIQVTSPAPSEAVEYGNEIQLEVRGQDLWEGVVLTVLEDGEPLPLQREIEFGVDVDSRNVAWDIRGPWLERVGTHELQIEAVYDDQRVVSDPFELLVTHTVDAVIARAFDAAGEQVLDDLRLPEVTEFRVEVIGNQLVGREVQINNQTPFVADADVFEFTRSVSADDFQDGSGSQSYRWSVQSGVMQRSTTKRVTRWGIDDCAWLSQEGAVFPDGAKVPTGRQVIMHANTWGFPNTQTELLVLEDPQASFEILESDEGRDVLFGPGPDDVDDFSADIVDNQTQKAWTAEFAEDATIPIVDELLVTYSELFFVVSIKDASCESTILKVSDKPE